MVLWLSVALGGAFGAMARYGISVAFASAHTKFPVATLTANLIGSFLMGVCYVLIMEKAALPPFWRHILMIGFLGAFTTFSTFSLEGLHLIQSGQIVIAISYLLGSVLAGILCVYLGITVTENLF